jgi:hypothetical protein
MNLKVLLLIILYDFIYSFYLYRFEITPSNGSTEASQRLDAAIINFS